MRPWWEWGSWQFRAVVTQANAAGGAITIDFTLATGDTMLVLLLRGSNSGTNTLQILRTDEDFNTIGTYLLVASGAASSGGIPRKGPTDGTTDSALADSTSESSRLYRGDETLTIRQTGAGAQNDTLTLLVSILLAPGTLKPDPAKDRSTNAGNVTIATPTVDKVV